MKIEISQDQNTLTIDSEVYEAKPITTRHPCGDCAFNVPFSHAIPIECEITATAGYCYSSFRNNKKNIVWVKKEVAK